jgi:hypothetical protein
MLATVADDAVRERAAEILAQPPYARWRTIEDDALRDPIDWLAGMFAWLDRISVDSPLLYWAILAGLASLLAVLLFHIAVSIRAALSTRGPAAPAPTAPESPRWREEAERLAAQGRYLEATHRLALGSVHLLVRGGFIALGRFEANRVLRERIRSAPLPPALGGELLRLLDAFERRWFRDRVEDDVLYRAWDAAFVRVAMLGGPRS